MTETPKDKRAAALERIKALKAGRAGKRPATAETQGRPGARPPKHGPNHGAGHRPQGG